MLYTQETATTLMATESEQNSPEEVPIGTEMVLGEEGAASAEDAEEAGDQGHPDGLTTGL